MSNLPLMPKATAVWLVDNTSLTFEQIAAFCGLHVLEVKGIADGDVAQGIKGMDPISAGELTRMRSGSAGLVCVSHENLRSQGRNPQDQA